MIRDRLLRAWRPASLRLRILVATATLATLAMLLAVAAFGFTLDRILYASAITTASNQADQVATELRERSTERTSDVIDDIATHGSLLQVLDRQQHVVAATESSVGNLAIVDLAPPPGKEMNRQLGGIPGDQADPYAVVAQGLSHATKDGGTVLVVATPLRGETQLVKGATLALGVLALGLLGGLLWLIDRVLRSALGSVEQIRRSVEGIRASDHRSRIPVPAGGDEISRLATTMNSMLDRAEQADTAQRAFVSNASHELRSPLTTIRMITELSPTGLDAESTQVVGVESERMQHLVDDLLTLAKADDEGLRLERRDVDLDDIVLQEARRVRASSALTTDVAIVAARTTGDLGRLTQVVHNLVDNAMRHARSTIRLRCAVEDGLVVVDVDNDGEVVPVAERERIFDRFSRLQQSRDRDSGGSGLGLAIVRALARAHDGDVVATEAPDGWCRFRVTLPADLPDDDLDEADIEADIEADVEAEVDADDYAGGAVSDSTARNR